MKNTEIRAHRLTNQKLIGKALPDGVSVVRHFLAMQAQDYYGAKWAIGQRCGAKDSAVEKLFNDGRILRTHLCRPTWHFVLPEDIRWLLQLTSPRVHQQNAFMYRKLGLDNKKLTRAADLITRQLEGGISMERETLMRPLKQAGFDISEFRPAYCMMFAELEGLICSGPRLGKQFTYALLEERVEKQPVIGREEALDRIARRYLLSRGPASAQDLALWSGLTITDARKAIAIVANDFKKVEVNGQDLWYSKDARTEKVAPNTVHLLPNYDEYGIGYKDRSAFYDASSARLSGSRGNPVFRHLIILNGSMVGTWDRPQSAKTINVSTSTFEPLPSDASKALDKAIKGYGDFLGLKRPK